MNDLERRVKTLREGGLSERDAVDAIRKSDADQKKNPDKYLQPYKYIKGNKVRNDKFWDKYGDPEKYRKNVGEADYKTLLEHQKEEEDRIKFSRR